MAVGGSSLAAARDERAMPTQTALGTDPKTWTGTDPRNGPLAGTSSAVLLTLLFACYRNHPETGLRVGPGQFRRALPPVGVTGSTVSTCPCSLWACFFSSPSWCSGLVPSIWYVQTIGPDGSAGVRGSFFSTTKLRCFGLTGSTTELFPEGSQLFRLRSQRRFGTDHTDEDWNVETAIFEGITLGRR